MFQHYNSAHTPRMEPCLELRHRPGALRAVAVAVEQLPVGRVIGAAVRLRHDVVDLEVLSLPCYYPPDPSRSSGQHYPQTETLPAISPASAGTARGVSFTPMAAIVPETERERRYYRWYDLSVLYSEAVRMGVAAAEIEATKSMVEDAWDAYVETISDLNGPRKE